MLMMTLRITLLLRWGMVGTSLCLALAACGGNDDSSVTGADFGTTPGRPGEKCNFDAPCESSLICPMGGEFAGVCTYECDSDSDCQLLMGDTYYCFGGACAELCGNTCGREPNSRGSCPADHTCKPQCTFDIISCDGCSLDWCVPN